MENKLKQFKYLYEKNKLWMVVAMQSESVIIASAFHNTEGQDVQIFNFG
jgi:hypothetical protein